MITTFWALYLLSRNNVSLRLSNFISLCPSSQKLLRQENDVSCNGLVEIKLINLYLYLPFIFPSIRVFQYWIVWRPDLLSWNGCGVGIFSVSKEKVERSSKDEFISPSFDQFWIRIYWSDAIFLWSNPIDRIEFAPFWSSQWVIIS